MYLFEDYLNKTVILYTRTCKFKGILIEHNGNEEYLNTWGHYAHCLLSTSDGIIEIPDKDIIGIFCKNEFLCSLPSQRKERLMNKCSEKVNKYNYHTAPLFSKKNTNYVFVTISERCRTASYI